MATLSASEIAAAKAGNKAKAGVFGAQVIVSNIKSKNAKIGAAVGRGLKKGGLLLQRESMLLAPVDLGILKASFFTRATGKDVQTVVNVGTTAAYAIYVHENVEMKGKGQPRQHGHKGNYWDPPGRGQAKFLEQPFRAFGPTLLRVVKEEVGAA